MYIYIYIYIYVEREREKIDFKDQLVLLYSAEYRSKKEN